MFVESVKKTGIAPLLGLCVMEIFELLSVFCPVVCTQPQHQHLHLTQKLCYNKLISYSCRTDAAESEHTSLHVQATLQ